MQAANKRRAALFLAAVAAAVFVVITALLTLLGFPVVGAALGAVAGAAVAAWCYRFGDRIALTAAGATASGEQDHPRLHNIVEGLCVAAGVPKPPLYVVDDDAPNAFTVGRSPRDASVVVTSGLLERLTRIELEGVVAHELAHIRNLDILPATVVVPLAMVAPRLAERLAGDGRETMADMTGVSLTRYPPGLISALEKLRDDPAVLRSASRATAHLWIDAPASTTPSQGGSPSVNTLSNTHPPLDERIEALREL